MNLPVNESPPHAAFEEAAAAVAGVDAVMFPAAGVTADFADQSRAQSFSWSWTLGCESNTVTHTHTGDRSRSVSCHSFNVVLFHTCVPAICGCELRLHEAQRPSPNTRVNIATAV